MKTEMIGNSKIEQPKIVNVSKLDMSLFELNDNKSFIETNSLNITSLNIPNSSIGGNEHLILNFNNLPKP